MRAHLANFVVILAIAGCASPPQPKTTLGNILGANFARPPAGSLIVLLPPAQIKEVGAGGDLMATQLGSQLLAAGYRVAMLPDSNYNEIWKQEVDAVGGIFDQVSGALKSESYTLAMSHLASRVCMETKCAMIIKQKLVDRTATINGAVADWDGTSRRIPLKNALGESWKFNGTTTGISVELTAVMADGAIGFRMYGGASLMFQTNVLDAVNEPRPGLFQDDKEIADGVRVALQPLLSK